jgi:hypothetical protein
MPAPEEGGGPALAGPAPGGPSPGEPVDRETVRDLLKRTAVALKQAGVPFALCGGYAAWVRGAPEPDHDADFLVPAADADRAAAALADAGLPVVEPAEDWLVKVVTDNAFIDVLWRTCGAPVENDLIERAEDMSVLSVHMPVLEATDIVVTKIMALDEHYCDFGRLLVPPCPVPHVPVTDPADAGREGDAEQGAGACRHEQRRVPAGHRPVADQRRHGDDAERRPRPGQRRPVGLGLPRSGHRPATSTPTSTATHTTTVPKAASTPGASRLAGSGRSAAIAASYRRHRTKPPTAAPSPTPTSARATAALPQRAPRSGA